MKYRLSVVNKTDWPEWFVVPLYRWLCKRAGVRGALVVTLTNSGSWQTFSGVASGVRQTVRIGRRVKMRGGWPYVCGYPGIPEARKVECRCRVELFVYLAAHETSHRTDHRRLDARWNRRRERECLAQVFADEAVRDFRRDWARVLRPQMVAMARRLRARARRAARPVDDRARRLAASEAALKRWQTKARLAATKVKRYQREVAAARRALGLEK